MLALATINQRDLHINWSDLPGNYTGINTIDKCPFGAGKEIKFFVLRSNFVLCYTRLVST